MIHFGIVGCGHIAKKHIAAIQAIKDAKVTAVCDTNEERLQAFVEEDIEGYIDINEMLISSDVDVVSICTPSGLHARLTAEVAEAKKHVIVEKPMALTLEDADKMISVCKENDVKLAVVHPNRFRPAVTFLRKKIENDAFGKIGHANATVRWNRNQAYYDQSAWRGTKALDGGVLLNQAIHNIDLLLWMMGDVKEVFSYEATRLRDIEAEDTSLSVLTFESGALGVIEAAVTIYPKNLEESLSIFGEKGTVVVGGPTANWIKTWEFKEEELQGKEKIVQLVNDDPFGIPGHQHIIQDMVEAIYEDRDPAVTGIQGKDALCVITACQLSAERKKPVQMKELKGGRKQ